MTIINDEYYMKFALQLAAVAQGQTSINPVVGCVLVREGAIVGFGAHLQRGEGHAEVQALRMAGERANGSTAYVTLEPCCHFGKTPPCADQLIASGVARVVVATVDPHHRVAGQGIERLRANGIQVDIGLLEQQATEMNEHFNHYITTKRPFVTFKTATSLDGKIATQTGDSKWITGPASREYVHTLRHQHQAIMVGISTVLVDNPSLTTRLSVPGLHPIRIVVDSQLRIPLDANLVTDQLADTWVVTTERASAEKELELTQRGVKVIRCGDSSQVDLKRMMDKLGALEIGSILLESGGQLSGALLAEQLIQKIIWFIAPKIIGGQSAPVGLAWQGAQSIGDSISLTRMETKQIADDIMVTAYPKYS